MTSLHMCTSYLEMSCFKRLALISSSFVLIDKDFLSNFALLWHHVFTAFIDFVIFLLSKESNDFCVQLLETLTISVFCV